MKNNLFWQILESEHPRAEAFCRKLAGNRDDGDDLYQDALVTAYRKFDSLRNRDSFRAWLYRIIVNTFKNRHRAPWKHRRVTFEEVPLDNLTGQDPSPRYTAQRWLNRAMRNLKPADKVLVVLFEIEGWSVKELAEMLGKPEGTIKSRLSRTRRKMRQALIEYLGDGEHKSILSEVEYALSRVKKTD